MPQLNSLRVIMSGGGTGGHIFPAIAIANRIQEERSNTEILFVGAKGKMEMEKVPAAGFPIEGLWISGIQRQLTIDNLSFPFKVVSSLYHARKILNKFKPHVVVGTGGFASGPLLYMASWMGIPTLIQEQNSYPGITNKLLANKATKICVAYPHMERFFPAEKIVLTGNPVRKDIVQLEGKTAEALSFFNLDSKKPTILAVGGSLGALSINKSMAQSAEMLNQAGINVIWQTGKTFYKQAQEAAQNKPNVHVYDFIQRMDLAYAAANLVISRAGAGAISELSLVGKPCILVPFPHAAEDHQTKNALSLVEQQAAILIRDIDADKKLVETALSLIHNPEQLALLSTSIQQMGHKNAAQTIAQLVINIANDTTNGLD